MGKKYWLRGGLIALSIYVVVTLILFPFGTIGKECYVFCMPYWILPSIFGGGIFSLFIRPGHQILIFIIPIFVYFSLGSLIGLLYEKIKNKNAI